MTYSVVYTPEAEKGLDKLPPVVASKLMDAIDLLACEDPYEYLEPWYMLFKPVPWYYSVKIQGDERLTYSIKVGVAVDQVKRKVWIIYIASYPPYEE